MELLTPMNDDLLRAFAPVLTHPVAPAVRDPRLLMDVQGSVKIYYAPFEYVNPKAQIVLVGITPGPTQMVNANNAARRALREGLPTSEVLHRAKATGAFSGEPLRGNLIRQLEHWGVPRWLGVERAADLFGKAADLVQTTSLLRFPAFVDGKDYAGAPDMLNNQVLRRHLHEHFLQEVRELPEALFFGLGPKVSSVLEKLARAGSIDGERVITGMLHPSGNNTYRIAWLTGDGTGPVPHATNPEPYRQGRDRFRLRYLGV